MVRWVPYIERVQPFFLSCAFVRPYGMLLSSVTGFGFTQQGLFHKDGVSSWYRDAAEIEEADAHYKKILVEHEEVALSWIDKGLSSAMPESGPYTLLLAAFEEMLLYTTVIPYRLLSAIEAYRLMPSPSLMEKLSRLRSSVSYLAACRRLSPSFSSAAEKLALSADLCRLLTPEELSLALEGHSLDAAVIEKRAHGAWFILEQGRFHECGPLDVSFASLSDALSVIKGQTACKGSARGTVRIVNVPSDMERFSEGDVLVSISTNPSILPAMKKAVAIVTDEGGITCHAAIISRELGIPCVIGTKNATKVLHDGDLVEVKANHNVVVVLERGSESIKE